MHSRGWLALASVTAFLAACGTRTPTRRTVRCVDSSWRVDTAATSAVALCIPPSFERGNDAGFWQRREASHSGLARHDFFTLEVVPVEDILSARTPWPPSLQTDNTYCSVDCGTTDSLTVHWDSVGRRLVRVETGLLQGGYPGFHNQPVLQASWPVDARHWIVVQGLAESPTTLGEFRRILRSITVTEPL
jgi:hypothetical protein